ncbi:MAG: hypothetical protein RL398_629 [Planctomycetota bacterium]|jgi:hypothetical protein
MPAMKTTSARFFPILALLAAAAAAQAPDQGPQPDPQLPARLKELKDLVGDKKGAMDFQAIGLIQVLTKEPDKLHAKDKEKIAKALGDVFRAGKVRAADQDILYREAADALAKFGKDGAKELFKAVENKRFDDLIPLRGHLLLALGRTQDDGQVDYLLETATRSPHDELRAAAGESLGEFTALDGKPRREVVKQLIREWGSLHAKATQPDPTDPSAPIDMGPQNARKTLRFIESKWQRTLTKLTGVQNSQFAEWQRWLNKNPNWPIPPSPKK